MDELLSPDGVPEDSARAVARRVTSRMLCDICGQLRGSRQPRSRVFGWNYPNVMTSRKGENNHGSSNITVLVE